MPTNASLQSDLALVRNSLNESRPDYAAAPSAFAALDRLAQALEAMEARVRELEAQLAEVEDAIMLACDVSNTMVDSLALARFGAIADEVKKRVAARPKKHKIGCGYRGTIYTGECRCFPPEAPHE